MAVSTLAAAVLALFGQRLVVGDKPKGVALELEFLLASAQGLELVPAKALDFPTKTGRASEHTASLAPALLALPSA